MTQQQRRERLYNLLKADGTYRITKAEYDRAQAVFANRTDSMPEILRNELWTYPGMGYLLYHHILNLICRDMQFPDE